MLFPGLKGTASDQIQWCDILRPSTPLKTEGLMKPASKLNNLQVLRAFAAVSVALYHTFYILPGMQIFGSFGVDVFFVISGYIMARILHKSPDFFLRRRIIRIVPPYWLFTFLIYVVALVAPQLLHTTRATSMELVKSLFFIPYAKPLPGGGKLIQPLLGVGWTLSFEMLFYLSLAVGLAISRKKAVWIGVGIVLAALMTSFAFAARSDIAQFFAHSNMLEFIFGVLAYYVCREIHAASARRMRIPALGLCIASVLALICFQGLLPASFLSTAPNALLLGIPSFILIVSATILSIAGWDTNVAPLILIGDASYMLYLVHFFCIYGIDRILAARWHWLRVSAPIGAITGISLSILVAIALHLLIERPTLNALLRKFGGNRPATELPPVHLPG